MTNVSVGRTYNTKRLAWDRGICPSGVVRDQMEIEHIEAGRFEAKLLVILTDLRKTPSIRIIPSLRASKLSRQSPFWASLSVLEPYLSNIHGFVRLKICLRIAPAS